MACKGCGEADGHHKPGCGFSPTVLQITNKDCTLFHNVTIPAIMGDETEVPPTNGLYKNVLLYYEASGNAYFYSSDGIPTKLTYATTDYNALTNKPTINGVTLEGNQSSSSLGININDATLTLKQGDTTLGTFSANASENTEINIPTTRVFTVALSGITSTPYEYSADNADIQFFADNNNIVVTDENGNTVAASDFLALPNDVLMSAMLHIIVPEMTIESGGGASYYIYAEDFYVSANQLMEHTTSATFRTVSLSGTTSHLLYTSGGAVFPWILQAGDIESQTATYSFSMTAAGRKVQG